MSGQIGLYEEFVSTVFFHEWNLIQIVFFSADGHSTTTTKLDEKEAAENNTSFLSRTLFFWFDRFVLTGKNREINSKNVWNLDPEYR